ncbi:MAG: polysaccharide biosynthesis tyrosine autokinase [Deltaproteobacteria bacterium]|nr:polysaccharide biosynthesis tyrosine autokinase [Deltaproteobacteria bacterium]
MRELSPYLLQRSAAVPEPRRTYADIYAFGEQRTFSGEDDHKLWRYWETIRRHYQVIIVIFLITELVTAAVLVTRTPLYTATSTIMMERQAPQLLASAGTSEQTEVNGVDTFYLTQYQILKSRSIAARVILDLGLEKSTYINRPVPKPSLLKASLNWAASMALPPAPIYQSSEPLGVPGKIINAYLSDLTIRPQYSTRLVEIAFTSPDPSLSARIANAHVQAFILQGYQRHAQSSEQAQRFLQHQLVELEKRIEKSEADLNQYRRERGLLNLSLDDKDEIVNQRLLQLNHNLVDAQAERIGLQADVETIRGNNYDELPAVVNSTLIQNLKAKSATLQGQYASLANQFTPDFPRVAQLRAQLEEVKRREQQEINEVVNSIKSKYRSAVDRENQLRQDFEQEKAHAMSLKDASLKDVILAREVDTNRALYQSVLERIKVLGVASESQITNISVIDPAETPLTPSSPKKKLSMVLSGFLSLLVGIGTVFLIAGTDNTFKSSDDVQRFLGLPNLATVVHLPSLDPSTLTARRFFQRKLKNDRSARENTALIQQPPIPTAYAAAGEAFRAIRTGILLSRSEEPPRTILFSSAIVGEGKSLTAVNSAIVFAHMLDRVLLIDADLRQPRCHKILKRGEQPGLTEVLTGSKKLEAAIQPTAVNGLYLLTAGALPPNPTELLGSKKMAEILASAASSYQHVLIDSAPLLPVSDSVILSTLVDGVVLVVGAQTAKSLVRGGCSRLAQVGAKILGIVLNNVNRLDQPHYYATRHYPVNNSATIDS